MRHYYLAVVPDLEVLDVFEGDLVQPFEFLEEGFLEGEEDVCSVEPGKYTSAIEKVE